MTPAARLPFTLGILLALTLATKQPGPPIIAIATFSILAMLVVGIIQPMFISQRFMLAPTTTDWWPILQMAKSARSLVILIFPPLAPRFGGLGIPATTMAMILVFAP